MNTEINCVKDYLCNNRTRFGILDNVPEMEYLNITAQNVRFIATKQIRTSIPLPSVNGILNNCRGIINYPGVIDTSYASFRVTDAHEELVHCDTDKPGVRVTINGQIVVRSVHEKEDCPPTYIAIPVQVVDEVLYNFYAAESGVMATDLKDELAYIDGSCMTVQLSCSIYKDTTGSCPRYMARIRGNIVDKLWKSESIWIEGIRPYPYNALTFCDNFETGCSFAEEADSEDDCGCNG